MTKSKFKQSLQGYEISVTGRHILVTDAMKNHAIDKVSKIERFSDRIIDASVTMDIQKLDHKVDIVLKVDHITIKASASSESMYQSVDKAVHKIQSQLLKYKNKLKAHQAKGVSVVDMHVNVYGREKERELEETNDEISQENLRLAELQYQPHQIVKTETKPMKLLSYDEAIMKMELSGDAFMIFRSEEDNKVKVIYRREDEDFGIIEVE